MKKLTMLFLMVFATITLFGQLQRALPANLQKQADRPHITQKENFAEIKGNVFQNFETYTDFTLSFSPWTTNDIDGSTTYGIEGFSFLHSGEAMSFIVFNPGSTEPSLLDDPAILPHGGTKYAACFASTTHANNDWIISPLVEMGTNGRLKFWVKSYTSQYGLERYKVGVSTTGIEPGNFTTISTGSYLEAAATGWEQKDFDLSAYAGMDIHIGIQCVSDDAFIFMLDDIEITSQSTATSSLTGKVTDAVTGNPIENATVSVAGLSDITDVNGNYAIAGIPVGVLNANFTANPIAGNAPMTVQFTDLSSEGTQTVTASATGYANYTNSQVVIPDGGTFDLQISLSPTLAAGQYRFVLTWGASPLDLDSHLKTPEIEDSTYHIYYENQGSSDSPPYAVLDIDDQESFGPETTTIYGLRTGVYHYYIHNYSENPEITTSSAVVQIFNDNGLLQTLQVPTSGTGLFWDVCTMNSSGTIGIINQIVETEPGGMPKLTPGQMKKKPVEANRNIISWAWNFGDGGTSADQNPSHNYATNGSYTVSLTVSDGLNTNTETKNAYIQVGPAGVDEAAWEKEVSIYPNPAKDQLHISAGFPVKSIRLFDMNGLQKMWMENCGMDCTLDLNKMADGIYIIQVETEKGLMQRKVTIRN